MASLKAVRLAPERGQTAIEGFAVETRDDLLFMVKGLVHPPSQIVAYLRYVPDEGGSRKRGAKRYRRVYRFEEQEELLRARWPGYLMYEPMFGITLQAVPADAVHLVRDPRSYLQDLVKRGPADALEDTALHLVSLIWRAASIRPSALGLSGSMLLGLHTASSDIDLVVYGELESRAVHEVLGCLLQDELSPVARPKDKELESIYEMHSIETPLSFADFARTQIRKVNEGSYAGLAVLRAVCEASRAGGRPVWESPLPITGTRDNTGSSVRRYRSHIHSILLQSRRCGCS